MSQQYDAEDWGTVPPHLQPMGVGTCVKLKSGGPIMVVAYQASPSDKLLCRWFDVHDHVQQGMFEAGILVLA